MNNSDRTNPGIDEISFPFEFNALEEAGTFEGYAAIFSKPDVRGHIIAPGAFNKTLQRGNSYPMLWWHNQGDPIGLADVSVDKKGLKVLGKFNLAVQSAVEKYELMKQKALKGISFGYRTMLDEWVTAKNGAQRILKEIMLFEISPCVFPMHPKALVTSVKSLDMGRDLIGDIRELEMEIKSGRSISAKNMKEINAALAALSKLLKASEPSQGTRIVTKSIFSSIIEAEENRRNPSEPRLHLFGSIREALEKTN